MAASNSTWEQKHLPIVQFSFRIDFHSSSGWNNIPHTWLKIMLFSHLPILIARPSFLQTAVNVNDAERNK